LKYCSSSRDFNKLVIKAKMHANTYFLKFSLLYEIQYDFFFRDLVVCLKTIILFIFFLTKTKYLIPDLYLYSIKIQTNIDQNAVKLLWKITDFLKEFFSGWAQPGPCGRVGPIYPCGWPRPSQPSLVTYPNQ